MTKDEERRAGIIAAQAAREALLPPRKPGKRRTNWAASPPLAPHRSIYQASRPAAPAKAIHATSAAASPTASKP